MKIQSMLAIVSSVNTREAHDALIATIQQGGGLTAIYDQLQIK